MKLPYVRNVLEKWSPRELPNVQAKVQRRKCHLTATQEYPFGMLANVEQAIVGERIGIKNAKQHL